MIIVKIVKKYKDLGIKLTPQRLAILEYLDGNKTHPSAENIYEEIRKKFPMMSFATVYKTLDALKQRGKVLELTIDPERRRYDLNTRPHHHLICIDCKKIVDIHADFRVDVPDEDTEAFEVIDNHIEFYGICPKCKQKGGVELMAIFRCEKCGATKEGRCKPKKCPKCGAQNTMKKTESCKC
jgi:Fur family peroxide stress response transcriptional regulator